jgi:hypothetical protein
VHDLCDELGLRCQVDLTAGAARAWTNVDDQRGITTFRPRLAQFPGRVVYRRLKHPVEVVEPRGQPKQIPYISGRRERRSCSRLSE